MGYTTRVDPSEIDRSTTVGPETAGVEVDDLVAVAKVVQPAKKSAPAKTSRSARTK